MLLTCAKLIGAGLSAVALAGAGVGIGVVFGALIVVCTRNPLAVKQLFSYAILRSIPDKLGGIIFMFSSILIILPYIQRILYVRYKKSHFKLITLLIFGCNFLYKIFIQSFYFCFIFLGWIRGQPVEDPYIIIYLTLIY